MRGGNDETFGPDEELPCLGAGHAELLDCEGSPGLPEHDPAHGGGGSVDEEPCGGGGAAAAAPLHPRRGGAEGSPERGGAEELGEAAK